jgi:voltage-gated potassium channel
VPHPPPQTGCMQDRASDVAGTTRRERHVRTGWLRLVISVGGLVGVYYAVPLSQLGSVGRTTASLVLTLAGVAALGWAITGEIRHQLAGDSTTRIPGLFMLLALVAVVFALGYYLLEQTTPGQMAGLETRTDALYFTLSTLGTLGYGDVYAAGQIARGLVAVQIVFDVVFVAALVAVVSGRVRHRAGLPPSP